MLQLNNDMSLGNFEAWYVINSKNLNYDTVRMCDKVLDYIKDPWWKPGRRIRWRRVRAYLIDEINECLKETENN